MGKQWDRPWAVSATNAVGYPGRDDLQLPAHRDNRNANCRTCGGRQRGVKRCSCETPAWDRNPNTDMVEFQWWCETWAAEALRVLKPGGHLLAFGGTRTYHRMACAIEDAGFEIRDSIQWIYGSGFPKSMDVAKAMDKAARGVPQGGADPTSPHHGEYKTQATEGSRGDGDAGQGYGAGPGQFMKPGATAVTATESQEAREWEGWGTALKPAHEPIVVARKPLIGTVIQNVLAHGTGAINIDATRVGTGDKLGGGAEKITTPEQKGNEGWTRPWMEDPEAQEAHAARVRENVAKAEQLGRWPANLVLTHSPECTSVGTRQIKAITGTAAGRMMGKPSAVYGGYPGRADRAGEATGFGDAEGKETVAVWDCVLDCPVAELDRQSGDRKAGGKVTGNQKSRTGESGIYGVYERVENTPHHDTGGASRFFPTFAGEAPFLYCAKAARAERNAGLTGPEKPLLWSSGTKSPGTFQSEGTNRAAINNHPTVKPIAFMRWLVRLVAGPGAVVLDPFVGSGTTGIAVVQEGFEFVGVDSNPEYLEIARGRITNAEEGMASTLF